MPRKHKPTPEQDETFFLAGCCTANLSPASLGVFPIMLFDPVHRDMLPVYEARLAAGVTDPANLPGVPTEAMTRFLSLAAPVTELPALAQRVRDRWQRAELRAVLDRGASVMVEAQQDAAGMTSIAPAHVLTCRAIGELLEVTASLRMIADPLPVLLAMPAHEAATLAYLTGGELRLLAASIDLQADGVVQEHPQAAVLRHRAQQLRAIANAPTVTLPGGAAPTSGAVH